MSEKLYFNSIKEKKDNFFTEYYPRNPDELFATLSVNFIDDVEDENAAKELSNQSKKWIEKYPISIMANAFDKNGVLIDLSKIRYTSNLTTVIKNSKVEEHWRMLNDREFPDGVLDCNFLLKTYSDISFETQSEIKKKLYKESQHKKRLKMFIIIWAAIIPAFISILEFFSPTWVAGLAIIYSL